MNPSSSFFFFCLYAAIPTVIFIYVQYMYRNWMQLYIWRTVFSIVIYSVHLNAKYFTGIYNFDTYKTRWQFFLHKLNISLPPLMTKWNQYMYIEFYINVREHFLFILVSTCFSWSVFLVQCKVWATLHLIL